MDFNAVFGILTAGFPQVVKFLDKKDKRAAMCKSSKHDDERGIQLATDADSLASETFQLNKREFYGTMRSASDTDGH